MCDLQAGQGTGYCCPMVTPTEVEGGALAGVSPGTVVLGSVALLAVYGGSLAGLTAVHRKKGRTWYCSVMPSMFWSSLITGAVAAGGAAVAFTVSPGGA